MGNMRESSKGNWTSSSTIEEINAGSLQRIADAAETMAEAGKKMASSYDQLRRDKEWYQRQYNAQLDKIRHLKNSRAGYMAHLTRLRNKIANGDV